MVKLSKIILMGFNKSGGVIVMSVVKNAKKAGKRSLAFDS